MRILELADKLSVSKDTIRRWEKDGLVPAAKRDHLGWRYFDDQDVAAYQKVLCRLHGSAAATPAASGPRCQ